MNEVNKKSDSSKRQNRIKILQNEKSCKNNQIFGSNFKIDNFVSGSEDKALAASTESLEGRVESPDVQDNFFLKQNRVKICKFRIKIVDFVIEIVNVASTGHE